MNEETRALVNEVAEQAAHRAAREILVPLGIDLDNPLEVQKDLSVLRELRTVYKDPEFMRDMMHLRKWRKTMDRVQSKGIMSIMGLLGLGIMAAFLLGLKGSLATLLALIGKG